ncbi:MAG: porin family protein [Ginsengibacter sp.]
MKKQILLIIFIVISTLSFAQSNVSFGARVGISSAGLRGDAVNNLNSLLSSTDGMVSTRNLTGFFAGTYALIPVGGGIAFEPALYYSQKGYELRGSLNLKGLNFLGANAKAQLQSHYIDMPLLLKVDVGGLQLFAGPQFSYLMKADLRTTAGVLGINLLNNRIDATDQLNRWDAAFTGGIGYQFSNGINLMASYDYGLSRLDANKNVNSYNNVVRVGLGIGL